MLKVSLLFIVRLMINFFSNKKTLTPEYRVWASMKQRTGNLNHKDYLNYGGRGIKVCDRWLHFDEFIKDMGKRPSPKHSLDRIDNNGNYEPSNCRWATITEQLKNRRNTIKLS